MATAGAITAVGPCELTVATTDGQASSVSEDPVDKIAAVSAGRPFKGGIPRVTGAFAAEIASAAFVVPEVFRDAEIPVTVADSMAATASAETAEGADMEIMATAEATNERF